MEGVLPLFFDLCIQMIDVGLYPQRHVLGWAVAHEAGLHEGLVVAGFGNNSQCSFETFACGFDEAWLNWVSHWGGHALTMA